MNMLKTTCFYFLVIVFVFLSRSSLCYSRHFGPSKKNLQVHQVHLKNKEEITKLEAPSTNETKALLDQAHAVVSHGDINSEIDENKTKEDRRVKRDKTTSSKRVTRTWKVPKYSKKQPRLDQEHPAFNLDYMQPTTHPPHHN